MSIFREKSVEYPSLNNHNCPLFRVQTAIPAKSGQFSSQPTQPQERLSSASNTLRPVQPLRISPQRGGRTCPHAWGVNEMAIFLLRQGHCCAKAAPGMASAWRPRAPCSRRTPADSSSHAQLRFCYSRAHVSTRGESVISRWHYEHHLDSGTPLEWACGPHLKRHSSRRPPHCRPGEGQSTFKRKQTASSVR